MTNMNGVSELVQSRALDPAHAARHVRASLGAAVEHEGSPLCGRASHSYVAIEQALLGVHGHTHTHTHTQT